VRVAKLIARLPPHRPVARGMTKKIVGAFEEGFFQYRKLSGRVLAPPPSDTAKGSDRVCVCVGTRGENKRKITPRRGCREPGGKHDAGVNETPHHPEDVF